MDRLMWRTGNYGLGLKTTHTTDWSFRVATFHQLKQAELDEKQATGVFYKPAKILSIICVALGLLTLGVTRTPERQVATNDKREIPNPAAPTSSPNGEIRGPVTSPAPTIPKEDPARPRLQPPVPSQPGSDLPVTSPPAKAELPPLGAPIEIGKQSPNRPVEDDQRLQSPLLDLARPDDAAKAQRRLIELGYLSSRADGVWGPRSRQALQQFRSVNSLGRDYAWDEFTQRRLFSNEAMHVPLTYVGTWSDDSSQCVNGRGPISITATRAFSNDTSCEFESVKQETEAGWSIRATCVSPTSRWIANIKLSLSDPRLTWTSERGTDHFYRCSLKVFGDDARLNLTDASDALRGHQRTISLIRSEGTFLNVR